MNNNITEIDLDVGLSDCELVYYSFIYSENKLTFQIALWNAKIAEFSFIDPISFLDRGTYNITSLCKNNLKTDLFIQALEKTY